MAIRTENKFFDVWSLVHFGSGSTLALLGVKRINAFWLILGYELFENIVLREVGKDLFNAVETPTNMLSDVIIGQAGYEITNHFINKKTKT